MDSVKYEIDKSLTKTFDELIDSYLNPNITKVNDDSSDRDEEKALIHRAAIAHLESTKNERTITHASNRLRRLSKN